MAAESPSRVRSHWGWGWADRFPDRAARANVAAQTGMMLGVTPGETRDPVPLDAVRIGAARVAAPKHLGDWITGAHEARVRHAMGRSYPDQLRGFLGDFTTAPDLVARPRTEAQIEALFDWATGQKVAVVPFGGGTSVVGGIEYDGAGHRGVVSLDMGGFDRVLEVDDTSGLARIQAGMLGPALESALGEHGLTLRHFPQSFEFSSLGGWIATRAGGHFATVYTHIDDLVAGVRMMTPGAGVFTTAPLPGSGAGPDPARLVIGSEGRLGVITEAWMRVRRRPRWRGRAAVHFADFTDAVAGTRALARSGLHPSNARLLDEHEARLNMVAMDGSHVLLVAFESADGPVEPALTQALALTADHGGQCPKGPRLRNPDDPRTAGAGNRWRQAFIDAPYLQPVLISSSVVADTFETACTWADFPRLHAAVEAAVSAAMKQGTAGVRGHLGCRFTHIYPDGPAPYYTFVVPSRPGAELEDWRRIKHAASDAIVQNGGTITHHHAVGRIHRPWAEQRRPAPFTTALRTTARAFDPGQILNPGALFSDA